MIRFGKRVTSSFGPLCLLAVALTCCATTDRGAAPPDSVDHPGNGIERRGQAEPIVTTRYSSPSQVVVPVNELVPLALGVGHDSVSGVFRGHGVTYQQAEIGSPLSVSSGQSTDFSLELLESVGDLNRSLGISARFSVGFGLGSVEASASYMREQRQHSHSMFILARHRVSNAPLTGTNFALTQEAEQLLATSPEEFHERYGDGFVSGVVTGGELLFICEIDATTAEDRTTVEVDFKATYGPCTTAASFLSTYSSENSKRRIKLRILRRAGCPETDGTEGGNAQPDELLASDKPGKTEFAVDVLEKLPRLINEFPQKVLKNPVPLYAIVTDYGAAKSSPQVRMPRNLWRVRQLLAAYEHTFVQLTQGRWFDPAFGADEDGIPELASHDTTAGDNKLPTESEIGAMSDEFRAALKARIDYCAKRTGGWFRSQGRNSGKISNQWTTVAGSENGTLLSILDPSTPLQTTMNLLQRLDSWGNLSDPHGAVGSDRRIVAAHRALRNAVHQVWLRKIKTSNLSQLLEQLEKQITEIANWRRDIPDLVALVNVRRLIEANKKVLLSEQGKQALDLIVNAMRTQNTQREAEWDLAAGWLGQHRAHLAEMLSRPHYYEEMYDKDVEAFAHALSVARGKPDQDAAERQAIAKSTD